MGIEEGCLGSSGRMLEPKWGKEGVHSHGYCSQTGVKGTSVRGMGGQW